MSGKKHSEKKAKFAELRGKENFHSKSIPTNQRSCKDGPGNLATATLMIKKKTSMKDKYPLERKR